jgi:hypothetical protein
MIEQQCADMGVEYPFSLDYTDVEESFTKRYGIKVAAKEQARRFLGLPMEHYYRSSGNAASDVAAILHKMLAATIAP